MCMHICLYVRFWGEFTLQGGCIKSYIISTSRVWIFPSFVRFSLRLGICPALLYIKSYSCCFNLYYIKSFLIASSGIPLDIFCGFQSIKSTEEGWSEVRVTAKAGTWLLSGIAGPRSSLTSPFLYRLLNTCARRDLGSHRTEELSSRTRATLLSSCILSSEGTHEDWDGALQVPTLPFLGSQLKRARYRHEGPRFRCSGICSYVDSSRDPAYSQEGKLFLESSGCLICLQKNIQKMSGWLHELTNWPLFEGENRLELRVRRNSMRGWRVRGTTEAEGWNVQDSSWPRGHREKYRDVGQSEAPGPAAPEDMWDLSTGIWQ